MFSAIYYNFYIDVVLKCLSLFSFILIYIVSSSFKKRRAYLPIPSQIRLSLECYQLKNP